MSDEFIRHFISFIAMVVVFFAWLSGYFSGAHAWWWVGLGSIMFYFITYKIIGMK
ncbi:hypothetical protein KJ641_00745 [Patescibacteria group bacterium]|nr:hypothetical protein [Patescibacteria group bacterium]MBU1895387.1 hypothetical protein [Patescibacteria group bacterium]